MSYGGSIVSNEDLFSEKICKKLNEKENNYLCGNLAVNGYNLYSIIRSIKYKNFNNEDLIIITLIGNNFPRMFHNPLSQPFWTKEIESFFPALTEVFFIYLDRFRLKKYEFKKEKILEIMDQAYYEDLIDELNETLIENNKPYLILYSPTINEIKDREINQYFRNILDNKFINFYDLSKIKYQQKMNFILMRYILVKKVMKYILNIFII